MAYNPEIFEELKNLIYAENFDGFKARFNEIAETESEETVRQFLSGNGGDASLLKCSIQMSVSVGSTDLMNFILEAWGTSGGNIADFINYMPEIGEGRESALAAAVIYGSHTDNIESALEKIDILIASGGDISARDHKGCNLFHYARSLVMFHNITAAAAEADKTVELYEMVNQGDKFGNTPLMTAILNLRYSDQLSSVIKYLRSIGANPEQTNHAGESAMSYIGKFILDNNEALESLNAELPIVATGPEDILEAGQAAFASYVSAEDADAVAGHGAIIYDEGHGGGEGGGGDAIDAVGNELEAADLLGADAGVAE